MSQAPVIPAIGLGTFRLKDQEVKDAVKSALDLGYRHIDTAQFYDNEEAVGEAIHESGIPRHELFITTKVWHDFLDGDKPVESLKESLQKLGTDYVDLALIHWPSPDNAVPMAHYIGKLNEARELGLAKHIGVSNFTIAQVNEALAAPGGAHIVTNQIEVHPYLQNKKLVKHCQDKGLQVTGYMPLAVGKVMKDPVLEDIGKAHGVTPAQVALAWVAQQDIVVIPSSTKPAHQKANLAALDVRLSDDEMEKINALDAGERIANPDFAPQWDQ
ncbi:2,5-didehydrogluconate reductase DkgB [Marinimicrobium sp. LS-A18]|uniref:2,5-didehydrogluconate reductase DkgB n=1 Tax=Marinimicrobium sp. LS-A18 TaxID=1381596 RepID=UPI00046369CD|nr:2,5-didehydrogluconate reductase DkgB [Marinimicrobium sp. LS-A18]